MCVLTSASASERIASKGGGALGLGLVIGLATALWSANAGVKSMFDALNIVYEAEEKRSFFALNLRSLAFTIGTVAFLLIALTAIIGIPLALSYIGFGPILDSVVWLGRWPALLGAVILMLALLYRYGALPRYGIVAMDHSRECDSCVPVARRFGRVLLVRRQLRFL
jgi:membrane protein